jgi:hypothetical protein
MTCVNYCNIYIISNNTIIYITIANALTRTYVAHAAASAQNYALSSLEHIKMEKYFVAYNVN